MELNVYIGQKIKDFRKLAGMTQTDLAQRLETTKQTISRYEKGDRKPGQDTLFELTDIFKVSIDDFFPPTIPTTAPNSLVEQISDKVVQLTEPNQKNVLRYSSELLDKQNTVTDSKNTVSEPHAVYLTYNYYDQPASAGTGQYLNDVKVETIELPIEVDADFVVPIYGDSMEPEYHSGDYVFVKLSVDLADGDIGVFAYNGNAYIKQLRITDQGAYLHSLNPDYDNIPITADTDFRTIGEVVDVYREK
ncbi:XRE family transcriptional regulator [Streptococcus suis]|nr:XRE family transcriptional regulator [Streptococcus suis]